MNNNNNNTLKDQAKCRSTKSRVALYFHSLAGKGGGAEKQLVWLANALMNHGHTVHIITWDTSEAESFYPFPKGVEWHRLGFDRGILDKFRRLKQLRAVLKKHNIQTLIGFVMANNKVLILGCLFQA